MQLQTFGFLLYLAQFLNKEEGRLVDKIIKFEAAVIYQAMTSHTKPWEGHYSHLTVPALISVLVSDKFQL